MTGPTLTAQRATTRILRRSFEVSALQRGGTLNYGALRLYRAPLNRAIYLVDDSCDFWRQNPMGAAKQGASHRR